MNKRNLALLSAIGFALSGSALSPVSAADSNPETIAKLPPGACAPGKSCSGGKKFELTDDQLEKLSGLKNKMREASGPKYLELKKLKTDLRDKLTKSEVDKGELLAIQAKINDLKASLANDRIAFMADASTVFTAEQKEKMRRRMLMKNVMGMHHGGKRFHGKGTHGKGFHGKGFKHMKGDVGPGAESGVTTEASVSESGEELS